MPLEEQVDVLRLTHTTQTYDWGSPSAIPDLLRVEPDGLPWAEAWFGGHRSAPALCATEGGPVPLNELIAADHDAMLGAGVVARFGSSLPYLLKIIAAERPLSLQVHPHVARARAGHDEENAAGIPIDAPNRNFRDRNHKPELVFALTTFEALCGFRAPRRAAELLLGLDSDLARGLHSVLAADPSPAGIEAAFRRLLEPATRPDAASLADLAEACTRRLQEGSPSPRADRIVVALQRSHPGDPGVATSLLLNPVTLRPGDAMFVPAGGVHAYLSGLAVELMASSDNVLRAGLTGKHVDVPELLRNVDYVAAPPIRIAPEIFHGATQVFYAPVDDFELSVTDIADGGSHPLPGRGPRILLCLAGELTVDTTGDGSLVLAQGQAAFVPASDGNLEVHGTGVLVQADVP